MTIKRIFKKNGIIDFPGKSTDAGVFRPEGDDLFMQRQWAIIDTCSDIIMEVDNHKVYTWANKPGYDFFGEDVIGKEASYYFEGEQETYNMVQPVFKGSLEIVYVESWQRRKDGQKRLLGWRCRSLFDKNGNVAGAVSSARDLTDFAVSKEKLHENENIFHLLTSSSQDHIVMQDENLRYTMVINPQLGLTVDGMIGKTDIEILQREEAESLTEIKMSVLRDGKRASIDKAVTNLEGELEYFRGTYIPTYNPEGQIKGIIGYIQNITQSKLLEIALKESEEKYRKLVEFSPEPILVYQEGKFVFSNQAGYKLFGAQSAGDLLGKNAREFVHPDFWQFASNRIRDMFDGSKKILEEAEEKFIRVDGSVIDVEVSGIGITYDRKPSVLLIVRDITRFVEMKRELESEKARLTDILEGMNAGSWEWNILTGEMIYNERWAEIIGYSLGELGITTLEKSNSMIHPDDLKSADNNLDRYFNGETGYYECEYRMKHKAGHYVWVLDKGKVSKYDEKGIPLFMSGTHMEITERKVSEEKINAQLSELQRWYKVTLEREDRIMQLKIEVNSLMSRLGETIKYPSQEHILNGEDPEISI